MLITHFGFKGVENGLHFLLGSSCIAVFHQQKEFITAPAAGYISLVLEGVDEFGKPYQKFITDVVPQIIVVVFEIIQIHETEGNILIGRKLSDNLGDKTVEFHTVIETGEHISGTYPDKFITLQYHDKLAG